MDEEGAVKVNGRGSDVHEEARAAVVCSTRLTSSSGVETLADGEPRTRAGDPATAASTIDEHSGGSTFASAKI